MRAFVLVIGLVSVALAFPNGEKSPTPEKSFVEEGLEVAYRFIKDCGDKDVSLCLKMRALTFVDKALRKKEIAITDGVRLVRSENAQDSMRWVAERFFFFFGFPDDFLRLPSNGLL